MSPWWKTNGAHHSLYVDVAVATTRSRAAEDMIPPSPPTAASSAAASDADRPAPLEELTITTVRALIVYNT